MADFSKIKSELIEAGVDEALVERTSDTAEALRALLDEVSPPPEGSLKKLFEDMA